MRNVSVFSSVAMVCLTLTTTAARLHARPGIPSESSPAKHWDNDDDRGKKHWKRHGHEDREDRRVAVRHFFPPQDVRLIREYYAARYRTLPPGLQKKLYRTGRLPPGWEKKLQPLPVVVERQLIVLPGGYRRGVIDGSAVVYDAGTQVIIDVAPLFGR